MYSDVDNSRIKTFLRPIFSVFLIFTLYFNLFTSAHAGVAEKWEVLENYYDSTSQKVHIEARKITQQASNSSRYKVDVPVTASALGKTVKTMMWTGVAVAAVEAMLEGLGWIIDSGSKTIKRQLPDANPQNPQLQYVWGCQLGGPEYSVDATTACQKMLDISYNDYYQKKIDQCSSHPWGIDYRTCSYTLQKTETSDIYHPTTTARKTENPYYDPTYVPANPEYEILSDEDLGKEILGEGENKNILPDAIQDAYNPNNPVGTSEPAPKASDDALSSANPEPETEPTGDAETTTETDSETGESTEKTEFTLPNFCTWAPAVCDFFQVQKADNTEIKQNQKDQLEQDKTFFEKVSEWFDWSKDESGTLDEPDTPEITELDIGQLDTSTFQATAGCPAPIEVPINIGSGGNIEISYEPICQFAEKWSFVAPLIGFLSGAMILVGVGRKGEDGEL